MIPVFLFTCCRRKRSIWPWIRECSPTRNSQPGKQDFHALLEKRSFVVGSTTHLHDTTRTAHAISSGIAFLDPPPCFRSITTEPRGSRPASAPTSLLRNQPAWLTLGLIGDPHEFDWGPQSGTGKLNVRPATVSRSYPLYLISIDCLFPLKVCQCSSAYFQTRVRCRPVEIRQPWKLFPYQSRNAIQSS